MKRNTKRIIKSDEVEISGRVQLGTASENRAAARPAATAANAQAAIIENNPDFALIEVICPCGQRTRIKCQYPAGS